MRGKVGMERKIRTLGNKKIDNSVCEERSVQKEISVRKGKFGTRKKRNPYMYEEENPSCVRKEAAWKGRPISMNGKKSRCEKKIPCSAQKKNSQVTREKKKNLPVRGKKKIGRDVERKIFQSSVRTGRKIKKKSVRKGKLVVGNL